MITVLTIEQIAWDVLLGSWVLVAVIVTPEVGSTEGAVYKPPDEMVPAVELPPDTPLTLQVTAEDVAPVTVALNCCVPPRVICAEDGVIETAMGTGLETVTDAEPDCDAS